MNSVDVVIPCYNYARFLPQCVASVLDQKGVNVRVLIIDDCSSDDSESVGHALAEQDRRVEFRRHLANCGHIATYNEGLLGWASAEYSLLLSADDAIAPGALARATQVMDCHRELGMTYGLARYIKGEDDLPASVEALSNMLRVVSGSEFLRRCFMHGNAVETPTAVVRTELQQHLGGYRADLPHSGDMEMWMRFAANAPVGVIHAVQAFVRKHNSNMSRQYFGQMLSDRREVAQACEQILSKWGDRFPDSGIWRKVMQRRMSEESCWMASNAFESGDSEGFRTCLEFAEQINPNIRASSLWWRLQVKRFLGLALWHKISPIWTCLKTNRKTITDTKVTVHSCAVKLSGWWPGSPNAE